LIENAGRLITKDEIFAAVWPNLAVTDDTLVQSIGELRRELGENGPRLIKTIPRRGYRIDASVKELAGDDPVAKAKERTKFQPFLGPGSPPDRQRLGQDATPAVLLSKNKLEPSRHPGRRLLSARSMPAKAQARQPRSPFLIQTLPVRRTAALRPRRTEQSDRGPLCQR
jgi:hypothetical protein